MTQLIDVKSQECEKNPLLFCRELEKGNILFFQKMPFALSDDEMEFLRSQDAANDRTDRMRSALEAYSARATEFLSQWLPSYAARWKLGWTLLRSSQKESEPLNVDAFASRPLHGWRILRFFTNIHPTEAKKWITSKSFVELAQEFAGKALPFPKSCTHSLGQRIERKIKGLFAHAGLKGVLRSPYDQFMLRFHRFLKQNGEFQANSPKSCWEFPPGSCWAFFTDQVSHAALCSWHVLEQIFLIPNQAMLYPDASPVSILERLSKGNMVDPAYG